MPKGEWDKVCSKATSVTDIAAITTKVDCLVVAAGFEERALGVLPKAKFSSDAHCVLIRFVNAISGNDEIYERFLKIAEEKFSPGQLHVIELLHGKAQQFEEDLRKTLSGLP